MRHLVALILALLVLLGASPSAEAAAPLAETLVAADGLGLPMKIWLPKGRPKAVVLALHGFNDYSNAFAGPAATWAAQGIATVAYDQRGFGASPDSGLWPGSAALVADAQIAQARLRARYPNTPLYLLGESMGGAVAMVAASLDLPADGVILVAPAVWSRDTMPPWQIAVLRLAMEAAPWLAMEAPPLPFLPSDNIDMLRGLARDPLVLKRTRIDAVDGLVDLMDDAVQAAPALHGRLLILVGRQDPIVPAAATRAMLLRLPLDGAETRRVALYDRGYHMLLRDLNAASVIKDVGTWVLNPEAALPSGADRRQ